MLGCTRSALKPQVKETARKVDDHDQGLCRRSDAGARRPERGFWPRLLVEQGYDVAAGGGAVEAIGSVGRIPAATTNDGEKMPA